jgi:hypothetical protein
MPYLVQHTTCSGELWHLFLEAIEMIKKHFFRRQNKTKINRKLTPVTATTCKETYYSLSQEVFHPI